MKHEWKIKEKKCTDVEQGLENKNVEREYVIQVVYDTTFKRWRAAAIFTLTMLLLGLSCYAFYFYISSESMNITSESYSLMSESRSESQKSSSSAETFGEVLEPLTVNERKSLENEDKFLPHTKEHANAQSEVESDNKVREIDIISQFIPLEDSKFEEEPARSSTESNDQRDMNAMQELLEKLLASDNTLDELQSADKIEDANAHGLTDRNSDNIMLADGILYSRIVPFLDHSWEIRESYGGEPFAGSKTVKHLFGEHAEPSSIPSRSVEDLPEMPEKIPETSSEKSSVKSEDFPITETPKKISETSSKKSSGASTHISTNTKNDDVMADSAYGWRTQLLEQAQKDCETSSEKSSAESEAIEYPFDESDEFLSESSSELPQLQQKSEHNTDPSSGEFEWLNVSPVLADSLPSFNQSELSWLEDIKSSFYKNIAERMLTYSSVNYTRCIVTALDTGLDPWIVTCPRD